MNFSDTMSLEIIDDQDFSEVGVENSKVKVGQPIILAKYPRKMLEIEHYWIIRGRRPWYLLGSAYGN